MCKCVTLYGGRNTKTDAYVSSKKRASGFLYYNHLVQARTMRVSLFYVQFFSYHIFKGTRYLDDPVLGVKPIFGRLRI